MSANIPFEIQEEIIKRVLPVKSLIRFTSVSKQWKSLIESSEFITDHSLNQIHPHSLNQIHPRHLLISYIVDSKDGYLSIVDDDSFPHHKFYPAIPHAVKRLSFPTLLGCSHGLVCLLASSNRLVVFWNPSIRKSVGVVLPEGIYVFGFGVCPKTFDPKIVKFSHTNEAEVFTLSSGAWRSIPMNLRQPHKLSNNVVVIDGVIHWVAYDSEFERQSRIIKFDLTSEEFGKVDLPDSLVGCTHLDISKLKESLVVLHYYIGDARGWACDVWMMFKNGVLKCSFKKVSSVNVKYYSIIGFSKNGQPIHGGDGELEVYEPGSKRMNDLGFYGYVFRMASYTESLLLLNHPDSIVHHDDN